MAISKREHLLILFFVLIAGCFLMVFCPDALALEQASQGRKFWDLVMRIFNFGVIVFVILAYGRKPLMKFLHSYSKVIKDEIEELQQKRKEKMSEMEEANKSLEDADTRIQELSERIIELGKKEKISIIDQARQISDLMIEDAKLMAGQKILKAKKALQAETVNLAMSLAEERLKKELTPEDNQKIIDQFILQIQESGQVH